ncbi:MAG: MoaD/ThiS family protein [Myxococcales bacterium]|nr:MoaD/ThiS family protein [Myxococcales bacterium]
MLELGPNPLLLDLLGGSLRGWHHGRRSGLTRAGNEKEERKDHLCPLYHDRDRQMNVRLLFFAVLRERAGGEEETIDLPSGSTVGDAYRARFPGLGLPVGYARNGRICAPTTVLAEGDEVALLPPLGGG